MELRKYQTKCVIECIRTEIKPKVDYNKYEWVQQPNKSIHLNECYGLCVLYIENLIPQNNNVGCETYWDVVWAMEV
jgi:hypothetical protein